MEDMLLHIGEDFVQPEPITLVNVPSSYMFMKMDGDGNPLSGVKFVLENMDGAVLRKLISDEKGMVQIADLLNVSTDYLLCRDSFLAEHADEPSANPPVHPKE